MRVCRRGRVELTLKEFQGIVEMPQPARAGVSRKLGGAGGDLTQPCWDLLGSTSLLWQPFSSLV